MNLRRITVHDIPAKGILSLLKLESINNSLRYIEITYYTKITQDIISKASRLKHLWKVNLQFVNLCIYRIPQSYVPLTIELAVNELKIDPWGTIYFETLSEYSDTVALGYTPLRFMKNIANNKKEQLKQGSLLCEQLLIIGDADIPDSIANLSVEKNQINVVKNNVNPVYLGNYLSSLPALAALSLANFPISTYLGISVLKQILDYYSDRSFNLTLFNLELQDISFLEKNTNIVYLNLANNPLTLKSLLSLKKLTELHTLKLSHNLLTEEETKTLKSALPKKCVICPYYNGPVFY